ncbi:response regulator transcription factor [Branchiibius sp. NY16-3462-2]|uniref:response regulator transcription factor n=1 Tax=Branchiibius sp. NY16-3462-2 TaxID=1807500 RepID=UPI00079A8D21|nr:response regulator transcription factor [Branchiibius sp. NY16-3462-2]KYH44428.1 DNA-binding response regulator [Branchiibius sp. NY16-3462-2]
MSAQRGLVVVAEDQTAISDIIRRYLEREGYRVLLVADGRSALDAVRSRRPVALILDIGLPTMDGIEVCRTLRTNDDWTPVLFVSARDDEVDRVLGIELGADDYLTKPFSPRELVARLGGVLRRSAHPASAPALSLGPVVLNTTSRQAFVDDNEIDLTATEFDLLAYLMQHPTQVFSRGQLLRHVWGYDESAVSRTVDVHVAQLRAKLGAADILRTVRGVGYSAQAAR